mmetsp:Transcript_35619/g.100831  ORF Transcript_35619/g.100831 Transcript_35619/m.100831 type:complete len:397 (-) Transcript_35619:153-1343(-)
MRRTLREVVLLPIIVGFLAGASTQSDGDPAVLPCGDARHGSPSRCLVHIQNRRLLQQAVESPGTDVSGWASAKPAESAGNTEQQYQLVSDEHWEKLLSQAWEAWAERFGQQNEAADRDSTQRLDSHNGSMSGSEDDTVTKLMDMPTNQTASEANISETAGQLSSAELECLMHPESCQHNEEYISNGSTPLIPVNAAVAVGAGGNDVLPTHGLHAAVVVLLAVCVGCSGCGILLALVTGLVAITRRIRLGALNREDSTRSPAQPATEPGSEDRDQSNATPSNRTPPRPVVVLGPDNKVLVAFEVKTPEVKPLEETSIEITVLTSPRSFTPGRSIPRCLLMSPLARRQFDRCPDEGDGSEEQTIDTSVHEEGVASATATLSRSLINSPEPSQQRPTHP